MAALGGIAGTARSKTLADIVAAGGGESDSNRFDDDILLNAVIAADLVARLADPDAGLMRFAPDDFAFVRLVRDFGYEGRDEAGAWDAIVVVLTDPGKGDPIPCRRTTSRAHAARA
ncbi:MAG: hypothetical protein SYC29_09335 [Planctomycetota bacterium]|nr:hypothetical protein [Planctomycetota bacterium]